jgi:uncharacterized integral membrane protein
MIRFVRAVLYILFAAAIAWLATSNIEIVKFTFSPMHEPVETPVYLIGLFAVAAGFIFGCIMVWINSFGQYLTIKKQKKEIKTLNKRIEKLEKQNAASHDTHDRHSLFRPHHDQNDE